MIDRTHDPKLESWVESANQAGCDFPIQNLPFVTFRRLDEIQPTLGVAIGDHILDVTVFGIKSMEELLSHTQRQRAEVRQEICHLLERGAPTRVDLLTPIADTELLLPHAIPDYSDFYASIHHATNVGRMFRPDNPLLPNYKWMPVGYHGRASSVVVSGTSIRRPSGQILHDPAGPPVYAPSERLDYELEIGAFVGSSPSDLVGVCLLNDWSARDIQAWEYQPLGPFLAKSFATSISPWVVTMEALEPFRVEHEHRPETLPHLRVSEAAAFDITLEVWLRTAQMREPVRLSRSNFSSMYWTLAQMLAHHTSNGCPMRAGDLIGSGTVSGPEKENRGCLLELTWGGKDPLTLPTGETRRFLEDGDEVILRGWCEGHGARRIGLGECRGVIEA
jgi:fumarylacetoacetase